MNDSPFSYELSKDKSRLKVISREGEFKYSADQVLQLALFFASMRADMSPPISRKSEDGATMSADIYEVFQKPGDGTAEVYLRVPGLGWSFMQLAQAQCVALAEKLNPQASRAGYTAALKGLLK